MEIIGRRKLDKFAQRHSIARSALQRWYALMEEGTFESFVDLRETFPQADPVPIKAGENTTLTVFNIGRNVRLIAFVEYKDQIVSIRRVLTHGEYDRGKWKR
jgi:mRNA interferase HigB